MMRVVAGIACFFAATMAFPTSFGVIGETFPVREMSLLAFIEQRLTLMSASGEFQSMEAAWQRRASDTANRPAPVGLPRSTLKRTTHYDPTLTLTNAILDEKGRVIIPAGTRVNGLEQRPNYAPNWLFFNADDKAQLLWAARQMKGSKHPTFILTGGAVRDAEKALNAVIYFDQGGRLSTLFGLQAVPAAVTREGSRLQIAELVIKENGDVI